MITFQVSSAAGCFIRFKSPAAQPTIQIWLSLYLHERWLNLLDEIVLGTIIGNKRGVLGQATKPPLLRTSMAFARQQQRSFGHKVYQKIQRKDFSAVDVQCY